MKIVVRENQGHRFWLGLPTGLICNRLTARLVVRILQKSVKIDLNHLSGAEISRLFAEIRRMKRKYPDLYLVDVESVHGDIVKIKL